MLRRKDPGKRPSKDLFSTYVEHVLRSPVEGIDLPFQVHGHDSRPNVPEHGLDIVPALLILPVGLLKVPVGTIKLLRHAVERLDKDAYLIRRGAFDTDSKVTRGHLGSAIS